MSARQHGASLLIPVLVLVTAGAFAVIVAARQSGGGIHATDAQAEATEALFLAETGVERATRRFLAGSACSAAGLSENLVNLATIGVASGRTISIGAGTSSDNDFSGAALPATQCRIQVTGTVTGSNVSRTVQAIIDRSENLIGSPLVTGFNNPSGAGAPGSWTGGYYDHTGGLPATAGLNPPNCGRAAYAVKALGGGGNHGSSVGTTPVSFTVNRPATLRVRFDYRMFQIPNGSAACNSNSGGGACVGAPDNEAGLGSPEGNNGDGEICFTLRDTAGNVYNSTRAEVDRDISLGGTNGVVTGESCAPSTQQAPLHTNHTPCSDRYNRSGGGAIDMATVRFTIPAGPGTPLTFDQFGFKLYIPSGNSNEYEMWIDNIMLEHSSGAVGGIAGWRDCSVSACPAI